MGGSKSNKSRLSEESKNKIASELGIREEIEKNGWGTATSKDCGNIVKKAIENVIHDKIQKEKKEEGH